MLGSTPRVEKKRKVFCYFDKFILNSNSFFKSQNKIMKRCENDITPWAGSPGFGKLLS